MKKLILILGNGLTLDLLSHLKNPNLNIDLVNLFSKGDSVIWPDNRNERGFLSYKHCPSLWSLGARPNMPTAEANNLIEDIITCANMASSLDSSTLSNNVYIQAYYELVLYLKHLFIYYNDQVTTKDLQDADLDKWGWLKLINAALSSASYDKIIIVTYNYDIFLERILTLHGIPFSIAGFDADSSKVVLLKPHGSISFSHKKLSPIFAIQKSPEMYEGVLSDFIVHYSDLNKSYLVNALIPPAGDSSRLAYKWAAEIRALVDQYAATICPGDQCVISVLSYWHVDRNEIDTLLAKIGKSNIDTYMVNPFPPRALSAVLTCILPNHITYSSSDWIGDIVND